MLGRDKSCPEASNKLYLSLRRFLPIYPPPYVPSSLLCLSPLVAGVLAAGFGSAFYCRGLNLGGIKLALAAIFVFSLP